MDKQSKPLSLSQEEVASLKSNAVRERRYASRISLVLAIKMLDKSDPYFDPFAVLDELDYLEGLRPTSRTKPASPFKGHHLQGLWHKHRLLPRSTVITTAEFDLLQRSIRCG